MILVFKKVKYALVCKYTEVEIALDLLIKTQGVI